MSHTKRFFICSFVFCFVMIVCIVLSFALVYCLIEADSNSFEIWVDGIPCVMVDVPDQLSKGSAVDSKGNVYSIVWTSALNDFQFRFQDTVYLRCYSWTVGAAVSLFCFLVFVLGDLLSFGASCFVWNCLPDLNDKRTGD